MTPINQFAQRVFDGVDELARQFTGSTEGIVLVPLEIDSKAMCNLCAANVKYAIQENGGRAVQGWMFQHFPVADTPGYIVAVHHVVWQKRDETIVDLTPVQDEYVIHNGTHCLFLYDPDIDMIADRHPDGERTWWKFQPHRYLALSNNPKIKKAIRIHKANRFIEENIPIEVPGRRSA